jgi:hypothetical protein
MGELARKGAKARNWAAQHPDSMAAAPPPQPPRSLWEGVREFLKADVAEHSR